MTTTELILKTIVILIGFTLPPVMIIGLYRSFARANKMLDAKYQSEAESWQNLHQAIAEDKIIRQCNLGFKSLSSNKKLGRLLDEYHKQESTC